MAHKTPLGALAGMIAAGSMAITPAQAAEVQPASTLGYASAVHADFKSGTYEASDDTSEYRRRWRGYRRYRRNRVDAGDVLAGVLILGGIAAVASAASNNNRRRDREVVYRDRPYDDRRQVRRSDSSGIDSAVDQCLAEIQRDVRVDSVDNASRTPSGWVVSGSLFNGDGFTCRIGNDGRISDIDYGSGFTQGAYEDGPAREAAGQWSADRYASARADLGPRSYSPPASTAVTDEPMPAYPGGPLPGEEGYGEIDGDIGG